jgi:hypothetical protein
MGRQLEANSIAFCIVLLLLLTLLRICAPSQGAILCFRYSSPRVNRARGEYLAV